MEASVSRIGHIFIVRKTNIVIELEATPAEQTGEVVAWFQWLLSLRARFG